MGGLPSPVSSTRPAGWPAKRPLPVFISNKSFWPIPKAPSHAFPPSNSLPARGLSKPSQVVAKLFLGKLFSKDLSGTEGLSRAHR